MDGDEVLVLLVSAALAVFYWGRWYVRLAGLGTFAAGPPVRLLLIFVHVLCLLLVLIVLTTAAAKEVRENVGYVGLFTATGAVALGVVNLLSTLIGISALQDAVERRNLAAAWAVGGAWLGSTLCICGANVGEGPTIYTTLGPLALSVGALGGCWLAFACVTKSTAAVVVDRDCASGVRLAGLLVAWGLVLGRAVAGDWVSSEATLRDFAVNGWPALALLLIAAPVELMVRPTPRRPFPPLVSAGVLPAVAYVAAASASLVGVR